MIATTTSNRSGRRRARRLMQVRKAVPGYEIHYADCGAKSHLVVASGELDLHAVPCMRETLTALFEAGRTHVVIDMSRATFIDSAMIGVLTGHLARTGDGMGSLTLVCSDPNVLRTLEVTGLQRELLILPTLSDAVVEQLAARPRVHPSSKLLTAPRIQRLRLLPQPSELARARQFAQAAARRAGLDPHQQYNLAAATHEAVANAIEHGGPCRHGFIELWVDDTGTPLTIGVRDGGEFVLGPPPAPLSERGRGLRMMSQLVDEISLQREAAHTVVRLSIKR